MRQQPPTNSICCPYRGSRPCSNTSGHKRAEGEFLRETGWGRKDVEQERMQPGTRERQRSQTLNAEERQEAVRSRA